MNQRVGCLKINNKIDKPLNMLIKDKKRLSKLTKSNGKKYIAADSEEIQGTNRHTCTHKHTRVLATQEQLTTHEIQLHYFTKSHSRLILSDSVYYQHTDCFLRDSIFKKKLSLLLDKNKPTLLGYAIS